MNPTDSRYFINHCGKPVLKGGATPDGYQEPLRRCILPVLEIRDGRLVRSPEQVIEFLVPGKGEEE